MTNEVRIGWLWFDNDPSRSLEQKVKRAAERYQEKFGFRANVCAVHPTMIDGETVCGDVQVVTRRNVSVNYFRLSQLASREDRGESSFLSGTGDGVGAAGSPSLEGT